MLRSNILILSAHEDQAIGSQIKDLLQRDPNLKVEQTCGQFSDSAMPPQLLIAILPKQQIDTFLRKLNSLDVRTSLLFVLTPELLNPDALEKSQDFLILPLNESELLCRVRRLINTNHRNVAIRQVTEACGLAQLLGEDPNFANLKRRI